LRHIIVAAIAASCFIAEPLIASSASAPTGIVSAAHASATAIEPFFSIAVLLGWTQIASTSTVAQARTGTR
jgi:hypothetical protein